MNARPPVEAGVPFPEEYADPRSAEELVEDQHRVRGQLINLERRASDASIRRELLYQAYHRRAGRDDLVQFVPVPEPDGYGWLIAKDELLIRTEHVDNPAVARFFEDYPELVRQEPDDDLDELDRMVTRYRYQREEGAYAAQRLNDIAQFLRLQGIQAAPNSVFTSGPVGKARAGPEPSKGKRPFPDRPPGGVTVAAVDNGISYEVRTDKWLDHTDVPRDASNEDKLTDIDGRYLNFAAGHGTLVAGIIQQVDPGATIRMYRALDGDGFGTDISVAAAMVRAVRDGARILNLSLGTRTPGQQPPVGMQTALEIIRNETGDETVVVAAAGNYGTTEPCWPASFPGVVSVAGLTFEALPATWSTRGPATTLSTISEGVLSTYVEGEESSLVDFAPDTYPKNAWAIASGTSFGAPQVAGAIARICRELREQKVTPRQALGHLLQKGRPISDYGLALRILPGT